MPKTSPIRSAVSDCIVCIGLRTAVSSRLYHQKNRLENATVGLFSVMSLASSVRPLTV